LGDYILKGKLKLFFGIILIFQGLINVFGFSYFDIIRLVLGVIILVIGLIFIISYIFNPELLDKPLLKR
jgi:hypothetical protein